MDWILIVSETREIELITMGCLQKSLPYEFVRVRNLAAARTALMENGRRDCKLIVSSLAPPPTADQALPVDRGVPTAFDFLREIRGMGNEPPCIFIDPAPSTEHGRQQRDMARTQLMELDDMPAHLAEYALGFLAGQAVPAAEEEHPLDVDVVLGRQICLWSVTNAKGAHMTERGHFKLTGDALERLVTNSQAIGEIRVEAGEMRRKLVRQLGRDMYGYFTSNEPGVASLWDSVSRHTDRMRTLEKARFHFQVDSNTSELLVEALRREDAEAPDGEDYWLLQTPFVRRFGETAERRALFKDRRSQLGPVQCLIILGNPNKFAAPAPLKTIYQPISQAADEAAWLHQYLTDNQTEFKLAPPVILRYSDHARGSFGGVVRNALETGKWQLVHYSGHSDIAENKTSYLVMGDHGHDLIDIEDFARACKHAQFIFLNSCRSANASFIQRSVKYNIPAVAGYAWPIRDDIAAEFSRKFYVDLFGSDNLPNRFLEYAFMRARCHLHRTYSTDTFWSSPLLFMQSLKSERANDRVAAARSLS